MPVTHCVSITAFFKISKMNICMFFNWMVSIQQFVFLVKCCPTTFWLLHDSLGNVRWIVNAQKSVSLALINLYMDSVKNQLTRVKTLSHVSEVFPSGAVLKSKVLIDVFGFGASPRVTETLFLNIVTVLVKNHHPFCRFNCCKGLCVAQQSCHNCSPPTFSVVIAEHSRWSKPTIRGTALLTTQLPSGRAPPSKEASGQSEVSHWGDIFFI